MTASQGEKHVVYEPRCSTALRNDNTGGVGAYSDYEGQCTLVDMSTRQPAMLITDTFGSCVFVNRELVRSFGRDESQLLGLGWLESVHHDDRGNLMQGWSSAISGSSEFIARVRLQLANGIVRVFFLRTAPLLGVDGEIVGQVGTFESEDVSADGAALGENQGIRTGVLQETDAQRGQQRGGNQGSAEQYTGDCGPIERDISEQRQRLIDAERTLRCEADMLARAKHDFLCTVSHELRTPLHAILGWAQVLRGKHDDATVERSIEVIQRNGYALARLLEDMLDMKDVLSGSMRLQVDDAPLAPLIESVIASLQYAADSKRVRIGVTVDNAIGTIKVDQTRMRKALWNLISNAVKFTPPGGTVSVSALQEGLTKRIEVVDTGCGISREFLPKLFEPFQQADSTSTRVHGGLGMGLSLARHLVELHGGLISANSAGLGKGAVFTITLP